MLIGLVFIIVLAFIVANKAYKKTAYYQITKNPILSVWLDAGRLGEYHTYKYLKPYEKHGAKFLFNTYVPKENGETSEIDVLMIYRKGMFVFESKNYSGWIFGNENQRTWYQTLPQGKGRSHKEPFYNPIMQNRSHIKHLKALIGEDIPMRSIIVFSERCTLKSVKVFSEDIKVVNRYNVTQAVSDICKQIPSDLISDDDVLRIYELLYPYTQVDEKVKEQHIANINNNNNNSSTKDILKTDDVEKHSEMITTVDLECEQSENVAKEELLEHDVQVEKIDVNEEKSQILNCPKCNSPLVLRTASKGANSGKQFYGCSNYPKCKYIKNL